MGHSPFHVAVTIAFGSFLVFSAGVVAQTPQFSAPVSIHVGDQPQVAAFGDYHGDEKPDMVVYHMNAIVYSVIGNGTGTFLVGTSGTFFPVTVTPGQLEIIDIDGDGMTDVIGSNTGQSQSWLSILPGNGFGGFGAPFYVSSGGFQPASLAFADFTGDGRLDVLAANLGTNNLTLLPGIPGGIGNGNIIQPATGPLSMRATDLNGDGILDLVYGRFGFNAIGVAYGHAMGGFLAEATVASGGTSAGHLEVGDLDLDGDPDVVVDHGIPTNLGLLRNDGGGGLSLVSNLSFVEQTRPRIADFDGDGRPDLLLTFTTLGFVEVLNGNANFGFGLAATMIIASGSRSTIPKDLDGDGRIDFAIVETLHQQVSFYFNTTPRPFGIFPFGASTPGCGGKQGIGANSVPFIGNDAFAFTCTNVPANSLGLGLVTDVPLVQGADTFNIDVDLWLDLFGANEIYAHDFYGDSLGFGRAAAPIPNIPGLVGRTFYAQALWLWAAKPGVPCAPTLFNLSTSNALAKTIQPG